MNKTLAIANTFLEKAYSEKIMISPMKMQKIIYILYKSYLKETNKKIFDEKFEVWKYGPVIRSVYNAFKYYGSNPITTFYKEKVDNYFTIDLSKNNDFTKIFNRVWETYKNIDGIYLSMLTHLDDTAWDLAFKRNESYLCDDDIRNEFDYETVM